MKKTYSPKASQIERKWHLVDASNQVLGRLATGIAAKLIGKSKVYFVPHLDCGDYVVVINSDEVRVTGRKTKQKIYYHHSGYPGGLKEIAFGKQMEKDPKKIIYLAVKNMLPKNKLRDGRLARLKVFVGADHKFKDKIS